MSRRIVSQTNDFILGYPSLDLPKIKFLEQDEIINDIQYEAGDKDPRYPTEADLEHIPLYVVGNKRYDSVHENYTDEMLTPTENNDYVIETSFDGNFTYSVLLNNVNIANKYKEDPTYLDFLGLPLYNPEIHKEDIRSIQSMPEDMKNRIPSVTREVHIMSRVETNTETPSNEAPVTE